MTTRHEKRTQAEAIRRAVLRERKACAEAAAALLDPVLAARVAAWILARGDDDP